MQLFRVNMSHASEQEQGFFKAYSVIAATAVTHTLGTRLFYQEGNKYALHAIRDF